MTEAKTASLTVLGGPLAGAVCTLPDAGTVTIGSAEGSGLHLPLPGISPQHVRIVVDAGGISVHETGAARRVYVNDSVVEPSGTVLRNGDVIWLGTPGEDDAVMLQCHLPRRPAEAPPPAASADATLAAIPLPAGTFEGPAVPTPEIVTADIKPPAAAADQASFALLPDESGQAETVVYRPGGGEAEEDLVFAEQAGEEAAPAGDEDAIVVESADIVTEDEPAPSSHVVMPEFAETVIVPPEAATEGPPGTTEEATFDETIEPPPPSASQPAMAPPPLPSASHPPQARPRVTHPDATHPPAVRAPHATHPPGRRGPTARKKRSGSRGGVFVLVGLVVLTVLAGLGWVGWRYVRPRLLAQVVPAPPTTLAQAATSRPVDATPATQPEALGPEEPETTPVTPGTEPTPEAVPTSTPTATPVPRATPTPTPRATPTPSRPAPPTTTAPAGPSAEAQRAQQEAQIQSLLAQAESALAARQYEVAIGHVDGVLRLDATNARATALRIDATRRRDLLRRRFVTGRTAVQTEKAQGGGLAGFDTGGADVRRAPDFQGRIEFEMSPASGIDAGAAWTLRIFVVNEGEKDIRVRGLTITTRINGTGNPASLPVAAREIAPQQRALVGETSGTWRDDTTSWSSEVQVTANRGDSLRCTLSWR